MLGCNKIISFSIPNWRNWNSSAGNTYIELSSEIELQKRGLCKEEGRKKSDLAQETSYIEWFNNQYIILFFKFTSYMIIYF
jgi:hypothetical protein